MKAKPTRTSRPELSPGIFWALLALMIVVAAVIRFYDLACDPPTYFAHGGQDLTTDGAYLTLHARQAVLNGQWDLFGYHQWASMKISLVSGLSYVLFSLFGVSRAVANCAGALLSFGGILLFIGALWKKASPKIILLVALFLCSNYMMSLYGRAPFAENGLLFLAGLSFFLFNQFGDKSWGALLTGLAIASCGLLGKSFGFILIAGPLLYYLFGPADERIKKSGLLVGTVAALFSLFWLLFYRDQGFFSFLWEQGTGAHGSPHGFDSPQGFVECLIAYGRYGLHEQTALISVLCCLALLTMLIGQWGKVRDDKTTLFALGWLVGTIVVLAPFNYLPLRYFYPLVVPMSLLAATWLANFESASIGNFQRLIWWRVGLLLLLMWLVAYYVGTSLFMDSRDYLSHYAAVWYALPVGLVITAAIVLGLRKRALSFSPKLASMLFFAVVLVTIGVESYHHLRLFRGRAYTLQYANAEVTDLVGPTAVIAGQYGPAITFDTRIRSFPLFVTPEPTDYLPLLKQYPITHLAVAEGTWNKMLEQLPQFQKARPITRFWTRDNIVVIVRVSELGGNPEASRYALTDYERFDLARAQNNPDSMQFYLSKFISAHPNSRAALADAYYLTQGSAPLTVQKPTVDRLISAYPTDFAVNLLGAVYYKWLAKTTHSQADRDHSQELFEKSLRLNPENTDKLRVQYETYRTDQPIL